MLAAFDFVGLAAVIAAFGTLFTGAAVLVTASRTARQLEKTNGDVLHAAEDTAKELAVVKHRLAELTGEPHNRRATDPPPEPPSGFEPSGPA